MCQELCQLSDSFNCELGLGPHYSNIAIPVTPMTPNYYHQVMPFIFLNCTLNSETNKTCTINKNLRHQKLKNTQEYEHLNYVSHSYIPHLDLFYECKCLNIKI